ncbi:MAG TPA: OsmC family protein [Planctomicrobium sp.]|nr:OsmC family protein [Planctomicrobium sp.]
MNLRRTFFCCIATTGMVTLVTPCLLAQATHTSQDWAQSPAPFEKGNSLRDFQIRFHAALTQLKGEPELEQPLPLSATVTAESRTGVRRLRIRNFQILSDGDRGVAEFELGAGSWPSVVGALGSAVAGDFLTQAALKGIVLDELEVIFTSRPGRAPSQSTGTQVFYPRNLAYTVFIVSPASDEELEELRETVERVSPVLNLVSQSQEIPHGTLTYTPTPAQREQKTLAGLREFLQDKYAATQGAVPPEGRRRSGTRDRNDWRPPLRAHIKVEGGTGIRHVRTDSRNFQVIHDYPRYLAGNNLGPVPEEHILGTMITCLTHIYEIEASKRQIALDTLELDVEGTLSTRLGNTDNPPSYKDLRYVVHIGSPETKEAIEELQKAVESICPIYNMLKDSQPIQGTVLRGPYTEEKERRAATTTVAR